MICNYIYLKYDVINDKFLERRPSDESKNFAKGDFKRLMERAKETVDLIFSNGIDWSAFLTSFNNLRVEDGYKDLSIKAIEHKDDYTFVVQLNTAKVTLVDKGKIERLFHQKYQRALKEVTKRYKLELNAKDREIEIYRQKSADILSLAKLQASQPINIVNQSHSGNGHNTGNDKKVNSFQDSQFSS